MARGLVGNRTPIRFSRESHRKIDLVWFEHFSSVGRPAAARRRYAELRPRTSFVFPVKSRFETHSIRHLIAKAGKCQATDDFHSLEAHSNLSVVGSIRGDRSWSCLQPAKPVCDNRLDGPLGHPAYRIVIIGTKESSPLIVSLFKELPGFHRRHAYSSLCTQWPQCLPPETVWNRRSRQSKRRRDAGYGKHRIPWRCGHAC